MAQNTSEFSALRRTAAALHGFAALAQLRSIRATSSAGAESFVRAADSARRLADSLDALFVRASLQRAAIERYDIPESDIRYVDVEQSAVVLWNGRRIAVQR